ncbi:hypothetical protein GCM10026983_07260 [Gracilibacillus alcaliphilus]
MWTYRRACREISNVWLLELDKAILNKNERMKNHILSDHIKKAVNHYPSHSCDLFLVTALTF